MYKMPGDSLLYGLQKGESPEISQLVFSFIVQVCDAQGSLLVGWGDHMEWQGSNPGWLGVRQVPYLSTIPLAPNFSYFKDEKINVWRSG